MNKCDLRHQDIRVQVGSESTSDGEVITINFLPNENKHDIYDYILWGAAFIYVILAVIGEILFKYDSNSLVLVVAAFIPTLFVVISLSEKIKKTLRRRSKK